MGLGYSKPAGYVLLSVRNGPGDCMSGNNRESFFNGNRVEQADATGLRRQQEQIQTTNFVHDSRSVQVMDDNPDSMGTSARRVLNSSPLDEIPIDEIADNMALRIKIMKNLPGGNATCEQGLLWLQDEISSRVFENNEAKKEATKREVAEFLFGKDGNAPLYRMKISGTQDSYCDDFRQCIYEVLQEAGDSGKKDFILSLGCQFPVFNDEIVSMGALNLNACDVGIDHFKDEKSLGALNANAAVIDKLKLKVKYLGESKSVLSQLNEQLLLAKKRRDSVWLSFFNGEKIIAATNECDRLEKEIKSRFQVRDLAKFENLKTLYIDFDQVTKNDNLHNESVRKLVICERTDFFGGDHLFESVTFPSVEVLHLKGVEKVAWRYSTEELVRYVSKTKKHFPKLKKLTFYYGEYGLEENLIKNFPQETIRFFAAVSLKLEEIYRIKVEFNVPQLKNIGIAPDTQKWNFIQAMTWEHSPFWRRSSWGAYRNRYHCGG